MRPEEFRRLYPTHTEFRNRYDGSVGNLVGYSDERVAVLSGGCEYSWALTDPSAQPVVDKMILLGIEDATFGIEENAKREFWVNGEFEVTLAATWVDRGTPEYCRDPAFATVDDCCARCSWTRVVYCERRPRVVVGCSESDTMLFSIGERFCEAMRRVCPYVEQYRFVGGVGTDDMERLVLQIHTLGVYDILLERAASSCRVGFDGFVVKRTADAWKVAHEHAMEAEEVS
jgi:hypothetical protein